MRRQVRNDFAVVSIVRCCVFETPNLGADFYRNNQIKRHLRLPDVSAFVSNNSVPAGDLPNVIASVHAALSGLSAASPPPQIETPKEPAIAIKKSVTPDFIICLEDGKKFKSLKRHLRTAYGLSPDQYREKWKLPQDYPMVAPNYAKARSALAKAAGLGQQRKKAGKETK